MDGLKTLLISWHQQLHLPHQSTCQSSKGSACPISGYPVKIHTDQLSVLQKAISSTISCDFQMAYHLSSALNLCLWIHGLWTFTAICTQRNAVNILQLIRAAISRHLGNITRDWYNILQQCFQIWAIKWLWHYEFWHRHLTQCSHIVHSYGCNNRRILGLWEAGEPGGFQFQYVLWHLA